MIPIVFCASFVPCVKATKPPEMSWSRRNTLLHRPGRALSDHPQHDGHQRRREQEAEHRRQERRNEHLLLQALPLDDFEASGRRHGRADDAADQRVARARRKAQVPRDQVPRDRADEPREHDLERDRLRVDDARGDGRRDLEEEERADEVEDRRAEHSEARRERPRRDARRDRVRGVVEPVREVEEERGHDDGDERGVSI